MKIALLAAVSLSLTVATAAQAQSAQPPTSRRARAAAAAAASRNGNFVAPRNPGAGSNIAIQGPRTDGVIPRAARSGNPLQMINPFAPAEYGHSQEVVRHEDNDPYQTPQGIKLVTVDF